MAEKTFYYIIERSSDELISFLADLVNQNIYIPKSRIIGIARGSNNNWIMHMKISLLGTVGISLRREIYGNTIAFYSSDGNLLIRYEVYRYSDNSSLLRFYVKALDRLSVIFSSEIDLLDQRLVDSLKIRYRSITVTKIDQGIFTDLLERASEKEITKTITPIKESTPQTPHEETISQETHGLIRIEEVVPIIGSSERSSSKSILKPQPAIEAAACNNCLLYDENTGYCTLLMKRVEDPSKPLCAGKEFIKRSA